jgi:hypothetical protein
MRRHDNIFVLINSFLFWNVLLYHFRCSRNSNKLWVEFYTKTFRKGANSWVFEQSKSYILFFFYMFFECTSCFGFIRAIFSKTRQWPPRNIRFIIMLVVVRQASGNVVGKQNTKFRIHFNL